MKINSDTHYTQCFMHDPCDRSRDGSHISYPENTNGYRWGLCQECDCCCICNRLVDMRNEGRQNGLDAAREAIPHDEECQSNQDDADERDCNCGRPHALAAIDALQEKP